MNPSATMDNNPTKTMHACPSTMDRLNSLPDNITGCILSLLPLREAARTSLLSSSWRNKWIYIPELVFDNEFSNKEDINKDKLIWLDIFRILLLHRGAITGLKFCIDKLEICPEVDQLFLFLCAKTIQEFTFRIDAEKSYSTAYRLPAYLFSYDNLRKLTLSCCVFKPPTTFRGFHRLVHLAFYEVSFQCEDFHKGFISHCPLLEHLTMDSCVDIPCFVIDFPNLKSLYLDGCPFSSFIFKRSPLLSTVEILHYVNVGDDSSNCLISFFDCLPALKSMRVSYNFLEPLFKYLTSFESPKRLPTNIQSLQTLALEDICFPHLREVSWVMCLVMSCPNVKCLKIKGFAEVRLSLWECLNMRMSQTILQSSLQEWRWWTLVVQCQS